MKVAEVGFTGDREAAERPCETAGSGPLIGKGMIHDVSERVEKFRRDPSTTEFAWTSCEMKLMIVVAEAQRPATNLAPNR